MIRTLVTIFAVLSLMGCQRSEPTPSNDDAAAQVAATAAEHAHDVPIPSPLTAPAPSAPLLEQTVAYGEGKGTNLVGFLAMPADAAEPLPGLIVIHEWWGLNENIKAMTRRLAGEGYVALAVDLYGGAVAQTPEQAQALMTGIVSDEDAARSNLRQAYQYLEKYALAPRIGSIGWCLGGGWSLQTAMMFPDDLDAMVMYYGQLVTDSAELAKVHSPILGFFGELDESIPVRDVQSFRESLRQLGKQSEVLIYPHAKHAFANPSGGNYDEKAAMDAWEKTLAFLKANLKAPSK